MGKYRCTIVETLKLQVEIMADCEEDARQQLIAGFGNEEYVLSCEDYHDTNFYCEEIEKAEIELEL
ncbi:MAG: hypothetical protein J6B71_04980 [Clostridia bacterium]|nr:hypothetical protein [Clostridia bacterium]